MRQYTSSTAEAALHCSCHHTAQAQKLGMWWWAVTLSRTFKAALCGSAKPQNQARARAHLHNSQTLPTPPHTAHHAATQPPTLALHHIACHSTTAQPAYARCRCLAETSYSLMVHLLRSTTPGQNPDPQPHRQQHLDAWDSTHSCMHPATPPQHYHTPAPDTTAAQICTTVPGQALPGAVQCSTHYSAVHTPKAPRS
jgi:hypothetical protein